MYDSKQQRTEASRLIRKNRIADATTKALFERPTSKTVTRGRLAESRQIISLLDGCLNADEATSLPQTTSSSHRRHRPLPPASRGNSKEGAPLKEGDHVFCESREFSNLGISSLKNTASQLAKSGAPAFRRSTLRSGVSEDDVLTESEFIEVADCSTIDRIDSLFNRALILGEGTYGVVYKATRHDTGEIVALKKLRWDSHAEGIPATSVREVTLLQTLLHPNIVRLKGVHYETRLAVRESPRLFLEFEYLEKDLRKYMKTFPRRCIPLETIRVIMYQLLIGLAYCHARGVIHRDIKPNNILLRIKRPGKRIASTSIPRPPSQRRRTTGDYGDGKVKQKFMERKTKCVKSKGKAEEERSHAVKEGREAQIIDNIRSDQENKFYKPRSNLKKSCDVDDASGASEEAKSTKLVTGHEARLHQREQTCPTTDEGCKENRLFMTDSQTESRQAKSSPTATQPNDVDPNDHADLIEIKIADFGLARNIPVPLRPMTHEVVTLWYRAPEILLGLGAYTPAIDLWAVGCVFMELLYGRPVLSGEAEIDTLFKAFQLLGTPHSSIWPNVEKMQHYSNHWPQWKRRPDRYDHFREGFDEQGKHLLDRLLSYDHRFRITAAEAIKHPWFEPIRQALERKQKERENSKKAN